MAEIHVEKKGSGMAWLWILLAILLIAVLIWLFWPGLREGTVTERDVTTTVTETVDLPPPPALDAPPATATATESTLSEIRANAQQWVGREFSGAVRVAEVPTDRGFWIEQDGQRLFAIVVDEPAEEPVVVNVGQRLMIRGTVRDATYLSQIPGEPLSEATSEIVRQEPAYLVVDENAIAILEGP